jgi:hypothetical protein
VRYITTYTFKPFQTKDEDRAMMQEFQAKGPGPGVTDQYVRVDGGGGTIIGETDDIAALYRSVLTYDEWVQFDIQIVLPVEDALPQIMDTISE